MNDFVKMLAEDRRLAILRLLKESQGSANESVLHIALEALGHRNQPRSQIREDMRALEGFGLLVIEFYGDVMVAHVTKRGMDVAEGRVFVEGVKAPAIGI